MAVDLYPFFRKYNFKLDGKLAYGYYRNRVLSFVEAGSNYKVTMSFGIPLTKEQAYQISQKIRELKGKYRPLMQGLVTNINLEILLYQGSDLLECLENILEDISTIADNNSMDGFGICPLCGKSLPSNSPFMRIKDSVIQAHDECLKSLESESSRFTQSVSKKNNKNIWKKILVSALITLSVVLLNILLGLVLAYPYLVALSGWFIAALISYFYAKTKTPILKNTAIILVVCCFVGLILSVYLGSITYIYSLLAEKPNNIFYVFKYYVEILKNNNDLFRSIMLSLITGLILIILPFMNVYRRIKTSSVNKMKRL